MKVGGISIKKIRNIVVICMVCLAAGIGINAIVRGDFAFSLSEILIMAGVSFGIGLPLWGINWAINNQIDRHIGWRRNPGRALAWNLVLTAIINPVLLFLITLAMFWYFNRGHFSFEANSGAIAANTAVASLVGFLFWGVLALREFFWAYKDSLLKQEQLKREAVLYQYEMLKAQVNPHFLFNSLNVLTSLAETDSAAAVKFIRKLAEVYRYVLDAKDKECVPLEDELALVESYTYMQKIRFGNSLDVAVGSMPKHRHIVPLALQMLVENAIKHNRVSLSEPLSIRICAAGDYVVCTNNYQPKATVGVPSGIGLKNIGERYSMLASTQMEYGLHDGCFVVRLPLL